MRSIIGIVAIRPTTVVALALTATTAACCCGGRTELPVPPPRPPVTVTSVITFDELAMNTLVGGQYRAQGVEFVRGPLFDGFAAASVLPKVWSVDGEQRNKVVGLQPFDPSPDAAAHRPNIMWGMLRYPTQQMRVRVRNLIGYPIEVQLIARDNLGGFHPSKRLLPRESRLITPLYAATDGSSYLTQFVVFAEHGLIAVDEIWFEYTK